MARKYGRDGAKRDLPQMSYGGVTPAGEYEATRGALADEAGLGGITDYDFENPYDEASGPQSMTRRQGGPEVPEGFGIAGLGETYQDPAEYITEATIAAMMAAHPRAQNMETRPARNKAYYARRRPVMAPEENRKYDYWIQTNRKLKGT